MILTGYYVLTLVLLFWVRLDIVIIAGMLLLPMLLAAFFWKLKGAVVSALINSSLFVLAYSAFKPLSFPRLLVAAISYLIVGLVLGVLMNLLEKERKKLFASEQRYRRLYEELKTYLELVPVMVVALDLEGNVKFVNKKACEILECCEEEIVGKNWFENFLPDPIKDEVREVFERIKNGELEPVRVHENPVITRTKKERLILWHNSFLRSENGQIEFIVSAGMDVTERRQLESKLEEEFRMTQILLETATGLLMSDLNAEERATIVTKTCVEKLGASLAWVGYAAPDRSVQIFGTYPPNHPYVQGLIVRWDDSPYAQGAAGRSIKTGKPQKIEDTLTNHRFEAWREKIAPYGLRTLAAFPMIDPKGVYGTLVVYSDKLGFFDETRMRYFEILAHISAAALENARLFEDLKNSFQKLQSVQKVDRAILTSKDLKESLNVLLDEIVSQLRVDAAAILLYDPEEKTLVYSLGKGLTDVSVQTIASRRARYTDSGQIDLEDEHIKKVMEQEKFAWRYAQPLTTKDELLGVLELFSRSSFEPDHEWLEFLKLIAQQAVIAIERVFMIEKLEKANTELLKAYDETIEALVYAIDLRDEETEGHSKRVASLTVEIAKEFMNEEELVHVYRGALLHDIGKLAVPDHILRKPGRLSDEEWKIIKMHPVYAYEMLSKIEYLKPALDIPYCHHERYDGTGYPRGLKKEEIPLAARIFAVVDVYDALTHDRPYRKAWSRQQAIEYIKEESNKQFDPKVVEVFLRVIEEKGWE